MLVLERACLNQTVGGRQFVLVVRSASSCLFNFVMVCLLFVASLMNIMVLT